MRSIRGQSVLPPVVADTLSEAAGQTRRSDPVAARTGGPAGNASLTAWTGLVLLALALVELVTLLDVRGLISWHVVIGVLLIPPALLKTGTTGWRILRYYSRDPGYASAGPPPTLLRILGPAVVVTTWALLGSGIVLIALGAAGSQQVFLDAGVVRLNAVTVHQGVFVLWAVATGLHVLGRFVPALRLTVARPPSQPKVPGSSIRATTLLLTCGIAVAVGALALFGIGSWQSVGHQRGDGVGPTSQRIFLRSASAAANPPVTAPAPAAPTRLSRAALRPVR